MFRHLATRGFFGAEIIDEGDAQVLLIPRGATLDAEGRAAALDLDLGVCRHVERGHGRNCRQRRRWRVAVVEGILVAIVGVRGLPVVYAPRFDDYDGKVEYRSKIDASARAAFAHRHHRRLPAPE